MVLDHHNCDQTDPSHAKNGHSCDQILHGLDQFHQDLDKIDHGLDQINHGMDEFHQGCDGGFSISLSSCFSQEFSIAKIKIN